MPDANHTLNTLHEAITSAFDLGELKTLCFDLQVEYEDLPGDTRQEKVRELLRFLDRVGRQDELLPRLQQLRPLVPWHTFQPAEPGAESPFKGLHYFNESDAHLFFGREQLTTELIEHLRQHRFLAVVGASGSGKSSLVRAGVIPAIRRGEIRQNGPSGTTWPIHLITPGDEPLKALAATLTRDNESVTALKTLLTDLRADPESLDLFLYRQMSGQPEDRVLLVVDQFEELFTQCDAPEERRLFVENLVCAVQSGKQGRLSLILTLRADFYAHAVQYEALRPLLETRQKIVGAMNADELRRAIEAPTAQANWQFQPGLVETMLQDVGREPGALPLLSHALQETWARREGRVMTLAGYQAAGGVRRAIAQTADTVYASLTPPQQTIARNIFLRLTELGEGTEDTRRRASLSELLPQDDTATEVQTVLDLLARKRLLILNEERAKEGPTQNYAEVAHEALIREWPTLRQWLDENREGLRLHRQLTDIAEAWQTAGEDSSYLYRGGRLVQAQEWADQNTNALNHLEHRFLTASQRAMEQEATEREAQRQRELEQARHLAQGATTVRRALGVILVLFVVAVVAAVFGFVQSEVASDNLATATTAQGVAQQSLATATIAQGEAQSNLVVAIAAQQTALAEGNERATQEAIALNNANLATTREAEAIAQARISQSQALAASSQNISEQDPMQALLLAIAAEQTAETALAMDALNRQLPIISKPLLTLSHGDWVRGVVWNEVESQILSWSEDGTARVWNATTGSLLLTLGHEGWVRGAVWNEAESQILSWSEDGTVRVWDATNGDLLLVLSHEGSVSGAVWNETESQILSWSDDNTARVWNAANGDLLLTLNHEGWVRGAVWNETESQILSWGFDNTARVWDADSGEQLLTLNLEGFQVGLTWNKQRSRILSRGCDEPIHEHSCSPGKGTVRVWDVSSGEQLLTLSHEGWVRGAVWNEAESQILSWSDDSMVWVWDATTGNLLLTLSHEGSVDGAVWNEAESQILTWSDDGSARVWNATTGNLLLTLSHEGSVFGAMWNQAESQILSWGDDNTARVWNATTGSLLLTLSHEHWVRGAVWNEAESQVLSWSLDNTVRAWDVDSGKQLLSMYHEDQVSGAVWNEAKSQILSWGCDETNEFSQSCTQGTVRVWDVDSGEQLLTLYHKDQVSGAVWNKAENQILSWGCDETNEFPLCAQGAVRVWDAITGELLLTLSHEGEVSGAVWNEAESQILSWGCDDINEFSWCVHGTIRVWDVTTGRLLLILSHGALVSSSVWNEAESQILTWGDDGSARVWNATTGSLLLTLSHGDWVRGAVWNEAESQILTWSSDDKVRVWNVATSHLLLTLAHEDQVSGAMWNEAESQILSWGCDETDEFSQWCTQGTARVWDTSTGDLLLILNHEDLVLGAVWNEAESQILSWSADGKVRIWDATTGQLLFTLRGDGNYVIVARWNQDESRILVATSSGFVRAYYTHPAELAEHACQYATRNFTWQEWQLYFPGQPYRQTCSNLPVHSSVPENVRP